MQDTAVQAAKFSGMGWLLKLWTVFSTVTVATAALQSATIRADEKNDTIKHETGRCSIRGQCGKTSFFGKELPCPDNGLAEEPGKKTREKLVQICGDKWKDGAVCCDEDQV